MRFAGLFFSALVLAVGVSAATTEPMLHIRAASDASIGQSLGKRQISVTTGTGSVPSQCTSICNPVNNEVSLGCPVTACCTPSFETDYYNCLKCVGSSLNATNYAQAQNDLNLLYTTCVDMGYVLPQLALPGQPASGSGSSVSGGSGTTGPFPTSTAPVSPTTLATAPSNAAPAATHTSGAIISARLGSLEALMGITVLLGGVGLW